MIRPGDVAFVTGGGRGIGRAVAVALECDVADQAQVERAVARAAEALGPIDVLVNNAGVGTAGPSEVGDYEVAEWDRIVNVNLRGVFLCCRAVLPSMRERRRGTVVNVASITGLKAAPHVAPYGASKFGVVGLTQALIAENHRHGIRVCMVNPGTTDTTIWDKKLVPIPAEVRAAMMRPEDVAEVVLLLASLPERVRIDEVTVLPNQFPIRLWDYRVE